jgi:hypothetical protein
MVMRIVQILAGAALAAAGGYFGWMIGIFRTPIFPPESSLAAWPALLSLFLASAGAALLAYGVSPRTAERKRLAEEAARRQAALEAADAYYASKTRAADRDWRSGDLPPPTPTRDTPLGDANAHNVSSPPSIEAIEPEPATTTPDVAPAPSPQSETAPLSATSLEAETIELGEPTEAAPKTAPETQDPPPPASSSASAISPLRLIRDAIASGDLDEAERLLAEERNRLSAAGDAERLALAELTGLAGDHAAAAGRVGSAKWLWRLALQRFAAADAIGAPTARDVSERLRLADN